VPAQWPVRSELFQVALAISFYLAALPLPLVAGRGRQGRNVSL